ncbi:hypothetical protein EGI24_06045 [Lacihabitans sp. CS3-21]|nr:hypothetical protein [Lacihabitans sp. CS3-21]
MIKCCTFLRINPQNYKKKFLKSKILKKKFFLFNHILMVLVFGFYVKFPKMVVFLIEINF